MPLPPAPFCCRRIHNTWHFLLRRAGTAEVSNDSHMYEGRDRIDPYSGCPRRHSVCFEAGVEWDRFYPF